MAGYKAFNPQKVNIMFGIPGAPGASHRVRGFGEDSMVEVAFDSDFGEVAKAVDGLNRHVDMLDRSGTITITLADHSESNAVFTTIVTANVPIPVNVVDQSSVGDLFSATSVKIKTMPTFTKGKSNSENVWVFQFTRGAMVFAGAFE